jgi:NTP pyrophosphatase (non-canonical NTP hydrolase)
MGLNGYKNEVMDMVKKKKWLGPTLSDIYMYFIEEVGELASAIRRQRNQFRDKKKIKITEEMGDVFSYLFQLADMLDIDLDDMWAQQIEKMMKKKYFSSYSKTYNKQYVAVNEERQHTIQISPHSVIGSR